jgi:uncharacterized protein YukE
MDIIGVLLRIARAVVESVIQTITQQKNIVTSAIQEPLQRNVQEVVNGAWKGDGATRFADEMTNEVLKTLGSITGVTNIFGVTVSSAVEILDRAEAQATQQAQQLYDVFNNVFK